MAHLHSVYDTDKHFIIDAVTRAIQNTSEKVKLIQLDHNSERFTFELPRYIDGHDMSACNTVEVHYNNIKADNKSVFSKDFYTVDDLQVSLDSDDVVIFSWQIKQSATKYEGSLNFCVRLACINEDTTVEYQWFTSIHTGVTVLESIYNTETILENYSDVLEAWKKELEELAASGGGLTEVAWEDIKNKPFGEVKFYPDVICDETATDRVVTEPFSIPNFGDGFYYVKVGELPAPAAEYLSKLNSFNLSNGDEFSADIIVDEYENGAVVIPKSTPLWFIVAVDVPNAEINGGTFPESGLYFLHNEGMQIGVQKATFYGVYPIDEKYMPEQYHKIKNFDFENLEKKVNFHDLDYNRHLPSTSKKDAGRFLRVNEIGNWVAETVPNAEGAAF